MRAVAITFTAFFFTWVAYLAAWPSIKASVDPNPGFITPAKYLCSVRPRLGIGEVDLHPPYGSTKWESIYDLH